jgi:uncharacterized protein (UPF0147 family)
MTNELHNVLEALEELKGDSTVPKNIKSKIEQIIESLNDKQDLSIRVNRALNELDEISDNNNIQPYTRTQIWNVVSLLESVSA